MQKEIEKKPKKKVKKAEKTSVLSGRKRAAGGAGKSRKSVNKKVSLNVKVAKTGLRKAKIAKENTLFLENKQIDESEVKNKRKIEPAYAKSRIISEKIESDKRLIMWSGVTFFMILIGFLWIFQVKQSIKRVELESVPDESFTELKMAAKNISEAIVQMKTDIAAVNDFAGIESSSELNSDETANESLDPAIEPTDPTGLIELASSTEELDVVSSLPFPEAEGVGTSSVDDIDVLGLKEKLEEGLAE